MNPLSYRRKWTEQKPELSFYPIKLHIIESHDVQLSSNPCSTFTEPNSILGQYIRKTKRSNGIRPAGRGVMPCWRTLWAICNIVSGTQHQTQAMVELDAVHVITETLKESNNEDVLEQGVFA